MKLGISVIVYNGIEFLEPSLIYLRPFAHYISLIYSKISCTGQPAAVYLEDLLSDIVKNKIADEMIEYKNFKPSLNISQMASIEREKRKIGQQRCKEKGCSHIIIKDCDEFYDPEQFKILKYYAEQTELTICHLYDYIGSIFYQAKKITPLHVPAIYDINCPIIPTQYDKILMDPERTPKASKYKVIPKEEVMMHHFTAVRYNENEHLKKFIGHTSYEHNSIRQQNYLKQIKNIDIKNFNIVEDQFNIIPYWKGKYVNYIKEDYINGYYSTTAI